MKLQLNWLNEYVKVDDIPVKDLAEKLVGIGFEVEEIIYTGKDIENVVSAKILNIKPHPDANKLSICQVDTGKKELTIVTGAKNIKSGDIIPLALDGAKLPLGKSITASPLRGVMSYGMMCSGAELNIDDSVFPGASVDGILILPQNTKIGLDIKEVLSLNDYVFDISITANRPDCQSVYGIAREISALLRRKLKSLNLKYKTVKSDKKIDVKINALNLCSRYTARIIENISIKESPELIKKRLRLSGLKPINNIVDITNYVLLEVGQPLHAFDLKNIDGSIIVREAADGEKIRTLDEKEYFLKNSMLVIADSNKALAIAGVMGGIFSGINADTKTVLLEAARFSRGTVRTTSRTLGLRSDSSARYEKGVDWESVDVGRERALALFDELGAGDITAFCKEDSVKAPYEKIIDTSASQICSVLGIKIEAKKITEILEALFIKTEITSDGSLKCHIPLFREDIDNFTDLAEEIIRFYGYDKIESTLFKPSGITPGGLPQRQKRINQIKNIMVGAGAHEIITYSFINPNKYDLLNIEKDDKLRDVIRILNPLSEEYAVMRTQTISGMLDTVYTNTSKKNNNFRLFEVARVYNPKSLPLKSLPQEDEVLSIALCGETEDFYNIKSIISKLFEIFTVSYTISYSKNSWLHPGISADIIADGFVIGSFGKIHPLVAKNFNIPDSVFIAQIYINTLLDKPDQNVKFIQLPKFPVVERDLALTVKSDILIGDIISSIKTASSLINDVSLFDIYQGEQIEKGYKSVAFSIKLLSLEKTLTDNEIQSAMNAIILKLEKDFGAKLRA